MKNTSKRLVSSFIACSLALSSVAFATSSMPADAQKSWASSSIERWIDAGLVQGDNNGNFNPSSNLTRGELATIFVNMFGLTEKASNNYADLKGSEWYADAVLKCTAAGIMNGDGVNCNATKTISRQEAMTMFARALGINDGNLTALNKFTDGNSTASWAKGALSAMVSMNIISGTTATTLSPLANIDRASMMKLLDNAIADYVTEANTVEANSMNKFVIINGNTKARSGNEVEISGYTAGVIVTGSATTNVVLNDIIADVVKVDSGVSLTVNGNSTIGNLELNSGSSVTISENTSVTSATINSTANVENAGTINNLVINAKAKINNTGKLVQVKAAESGIIINGNAPTYLTVPSGVTAPTNTAGQTVTQTGGSGGGTGSIATTVKNASNAEELKKVLESANGTLEVKLTGEAEDYTSLTESDALTFNGIKLTVDFDDIRVEDAGQTQAYAQLKLVAPNATSIALNDSGTGRAGAHFNRLTIDAPKADVENYVQFNTVRIEAVSNNTFHANEEAGSISIGCGSVELSENSGSTFVNVEYTSGATFVKGDVKHLTIGHDVKDNVNIIDSVKNLNFDGQATVTLAQNATVENATISSFADGAVINGSGEIKKVTANANVVIEGSTKIETINVPTSASTAPIKITVNDSASIDKIVSENPDVIIEDNSSGNVPERPVYLTNIEVYDINSDVNPVKTKYEQGDVLDLTNVKLKLNYSDSTYDIVDVYNNSDVKVDVDGDSSIVLDKAGDCTVTLTYMGNKATYKISVSEKITPPDEDEVNLRLDTYSLGNDVQYVAVWNGDFDKDYAITVTDESGNESIKIIETFNSGLVQSQDLMFYVPLKNEKQIYDINLYELTVSGEYKKLATLQDAIVVNVAGDVVDYDVQFNDPVNNHTITIKSEISDEITCIRTAWFRNGQENGIKGMYSTASSTVKLRDQIQTGDVLDVRFVTSESLAGNVLTATITPESKTTFN